MLIGTGTSFLRSYIQMVYTWCNWWNCRNKFRVLIWLCTSCCFSCFFDPVIVGCVLGRQGMWHPAVAVVIGNLISPLFHFLLRILFLWEFTSTSSSTHDPSCRHILMWILWNVCSDYLFKLLLIGDSGVGKSCLLLRFAVRVLCDVKHPTLLIKHFVGGVVATIYCRECCGKIVLFP